MTDSGRNTLGCGSIWLFLKAQFSAQLASLADFVFTILLAKLLSVYYLYATFLGSVVGGIVNCVINYKWVFHAADCKKKDVALKYIFVWGGSILLNTWGTFALTEWLSDQCFVQALLGLYVQHLFVFSKMLVAVLVAVFWNYQLQRIFVYRNRTFGKFWK